MNDERDKLFIIDEFVSKLEGTYKNFRYFTKFFMTDIENKELNDIIDKYLKKMKKSKSIKEMDKYLKVKKAIKREIKRKR